jgi:hypothetical protein
MAYNREWLLSLIKDDFSKANFRADVHWGLGDAVPGVVLLIVIIVFVFHLFKNKPVLTFGSLLMGNVIVVWMLSVGFTGKIEQHTQGAAIDFFESVKKENCYIFNAGYKTYAHYFYAGTRPPKYMDGMNLLNERYYRQKHKTSYLQLTEAEKSELDDIEKRWLIEGAVDRKVYFIVKSDDLEDIPSFKNLKVILNKNGFIVYQRID